MRVKDIKILIKNKWEQLRKRFTGENILHMIKNEIAAFFLTLLILPMIFFIVGMLLVIFSPIMVMIYPIVGKAVVSIAPPPILIDLVDGCKNVLDTFIDNNWFNRVSSVISDFLFYLERLKSLIFDLIEFCGEMVYGFIGGFIKRIPVRKIFRAIKKTIRKIIEKLRIVR